jgi:Tol biopolymer transport system component
MAWSPNGARLLYITTDYQNGESALHTVEADGTNHRSFDWRAFEGRRTLQDAGWRSDTTLLVVNSGERSINIYDLPANDLREERLTSRASIPEKIHNAQFVRLIHIPR